MSEAAAPVSSGTWRKGEFVRGADIFVPIEAFFVWLGLAALAMGFALAVAEGLHLPETAVKKTLLPTPENFGVVQAAMASYYLVLLFFLWRVARRVSALALVARYRAMRRSHFLLIACGGIALGLLVLFLNWYLVSHAVVEFHPTVGERAAAPRTLDQLPLGMVSLALIGPFVEELYFRGIVLSWLVRKMPVVLAVLVNAVLFGLMHFNFFSHHGPAGWYFTAVIGTVGFIGAILAIRTHSLWSSFALHSAYNATLISVPLLTAVLW